MTESDKPEFFAYIAEVYGYHRQPASARVLAMWWMGCQPWTMAQVKDAINVLTRDPVAGKYLPKIGDLTRIIDGTTEDRAQVAWNAVYEALSGVGAYCDVVFADPATMAAVHDIGGWAPLCRTSFEDMGYRQAAFIKAHRAYAARGDFQFPAMLPGDRSGADEMLRKWGIPLPAPTFIGDVQACQFVLEHGGRAQGGAAMAAIGSLTAAMPLLTRAPQLGQDDTYNGKAAK